MNSSVTGNTAATIILALGNAVLISSNNPLYLSTSSALAVAEVDNELTP